MYLSQPLLVLVHAFQVGAKVGIAVGVAEGASVGITAVGDAEGGATTFTTTEVLCMTPQCFLTR